MGVLTSMSRFTIDRGSGRMNADVKEMDVVVIELIDSKLYVRMERVKFGKN